VFIGLPWPKKAAGMRAEGFIGLRWRETAKNQAVLEDGVADIMAGMAPVYFNPAARDNRRKHPTEETFHVIRDP
jgi:hypothetical protein